MVWCVDQQLKMVILNVYCFAINGKSRRPPLKVVKKCGKSGQVRFSTVTFPILKLGNSGITLENRKLKVKSKSEFRLNGAVELTLDIST